ncbi:GlcG/HbpS family heme-binding protein [Burkholderia sp. MR1-5-21]
MDNLNLELVQALLAYAADNASNAFDKPICIAVCDGHGFLAGFLRMDDAPVRSIQISQQKAYTCVRMGVTTVALLDRLRQENIPLSYFCDPLLTALPGGAVLTDRHGRVSGAIGVSGLAPADDQAMADELARFGARYASPDEARQRS